jgi:transcriptional regulator with XRE-family HTH domain
MRLAAALRDARESRGLTLRELGARIARNSGVLSRYETGERTPKPEDVAQLLTAMDIRGEQYDEILSLSYDTDAPGWVAWNVLDQRQHLAAMLDAEMNARRIDHVSPLLIPGLLQSEGYMTAIMSGGGLSPDEISTRVAVRMGRRDALYKKFPVKFVAFIGEAALRWLVGGRDAMIEQVRHLLAVGELANLHVHVVPFDGGWQPSLEGYFMVIDGSTVHLETRKSGIFLHHPDDVRIYVDALEAVRQVACGEAESRAMLVDRLRELEGTRDRE